MANVPKAFLSYSWDDNSHKAWVRQLAEQLRQDGIETTLDQWHAAPGDQLPRFMEQAVRENDFVLMICTPKFKARYDERDGGTGFEGDRIQSEVLVKRNHRKFIPILRRGKWEEAAPSALLGTYYIDLRDGSSYSTNYQELVSTLHGKRLTPPGVAERSFQDPDTRNFLHPDYPVLHGSKYFNGDGPDLNITSASESIIDLIQSERHKGYGFVAIVGPGFSTPSGAPLVFELHSYLLRCIELALGKPADQRWRPRNDQWPPFVDRQHFQPNWKVYSDKIARDCGDVVPAQAKEPFRKALNEWRDALIFLSSLKHGQRGSNENSRLEYDEEPSLDVYYSCFRQMLKEKSPALVHKMLAVLAGALRLHVILTPNHDNLLEKAFAEARNPLDLINVIHDGDMPHTPVLSPNGRFLITLPGMPSGHNGNNADKTAKGERAYLNNRSAMDSIFRTTYL